MSFDCIVLGAGMSGLAAASRLAQAGRRVVAIEARDRIGGRIDSSPRLGRPPWERGAEFVHGLPPETWDLIRASGSATYEVSHDHQHLSPDGRLADDDIWSPVETVLSRLGEVTDDLSFAEFLERRCADLPAEAKLMALMYVEGFNAADARLISVRAIRAAEEYSEQIDGLRSFRLSAGYGALAEWFADQLDKSGVDIRLGQTATAVEWLPGSVRVTARSTDDADHSFAARQVIVTLPIGVLKAEPPAVGAVRWQPEVPGLRTVLAHFEMGPVVKLLFEFREPFWHAGPLAEAGFIHVPHEPFPTWWTTAPLVGNRLTGWSGGPRAAALSGLSSTEIIRIGLETLARTFSRTVAELHEWVAEAEVCDWQLDPFSRGAYSYVRAGGFEAAQRLAEPIANTVFFAGEATHLEMNGTVAGAIESGYRAASAALRA